MTQKSIISQIDYFTKQQSFIEIDHTYIHEGKGFSIVLDLGAISTTYYIAIDTPATKYVHYRPKAAFTTSTASITYKLLKGITSYTGGTAIIPFNRNENSSNTSGCVVKYGVTPTVGSAVLRDIGIIGTEGITTARAGGSSGGSNELLFSQSTKYLISIDPTAETSVTVNLFWYEEDEG